MLELHNSYMDSTQNFFCIVFFVYISMTVIKVAENQIFLKRLNSYVTNFILMFFWFSLA